MRLAPVTPPTFTMQGTLTMGAATVSGLAVSGALPFPTLSYVPFVGQPVTATDIPDGTTVLSIQSPTALTLSNNSTADGREMLTFGTEPLTIADTKIYCRIQFPDLDILIGELIVTARKYVETRLRSAMITQTWVMYLDSFPSAGGYYNRAIREIWPSMGSLPSGLGFYPGMIPNSTGVIDIPMPPMQAVNSVKYLDFNNVLQTVDPSTYTVSLGTPAKIQPMYSKVWPISRPTMDSVQVTFTCGFGPLGSNVPATIQTAMKYLIYTWYQNPQAVQAGRNTIIPDVVDMMLSTDDPGIYA